MRTESPTVFWQQSCFSRTINGALVACSLAPTLPLVFQCFGAIPSFEFATHASDLILTRQEDQNAARRKAGVDFARFPEGFCYIVWLRASTEVYGHWVLPGCDVDDGWRSSEKRRVLRKIRDAKGRGHDDKAKWLHTPLMSETL